MKQRFWHVSYDGRNSTGEIHGDLVYSTGPAGLTLEDIDAIKKHLNESYNVTHARIGFFGELAS